MYQSLSFLQWTPTKRTDRKRLEGIRTIVRTLPYRCDAVYPCLRILRQKVSNLRWNLGFLCSQATSRVSRIPQRRGPPPSGASAGCEGAWRGLLLIEPEAANKNIGNCERWCAQPLGCTRHATRGSLEVTMLGGMGGQRGSRSGGYEPNAESWLRIQEWIGWSMENATDDMEHVTSCGLWAAHGAWQADGRCSMSGCMAATAACGVWQAMAACRMWQLWRHAGDGCLTAGGGSCRRHSNKHARLEAVPSFIHATCTMVWSAGWGECERWCVQPLGCTRHATKGSLEVTMLGGMGGQRFTKAEKYLQVKVNSFHWM